MYVDLLEHLSEVERKLGKESKSYKSVSQAFKDHPNLRAYTDHLGVVRLCSADVNGSVDMMDITHRSDDGGSTIIHPFLQVNGQRVYADPPAYVVGYRNLDGFGEVPLPDWEVLLTDAGLSPEVIRKVKWFLGAHRPVNYDQVEEQEKALEQP